MKPGFKVGDLVTPDCNKPADRRGLTPREAWVGPMFWDEAARRAVTVKWDTPGIVIEIMPEGITSQNGYLDVRVLFEGRVFHCDHDRLESFCE